MPFPTGFPPTVDTSVASVRFYQRSTSTANWTDNAFLWKATANSLWPQLSKAIQVINDGTPGTDPDIEFSFAATGNGDSSHIHGRIKAGESVTYLDRYELGIALRNAGAVGGGALFRVTVW
jgi:hypothetical protein